MRYDKLVRDRVPSIILEEDKIVVIHYASDEEYWAALKAKLLEEVGEVIKSKDDEELKKELADVLEVFQAILMFKNFDSEEIVMLLINKGIEKGCFEKRIILEEVLEK